MEISPELHSAILQDLIDRVRALQAGFDVLARTLDAQGALDHDVFRKETEAAANLLSRTGDGKVSARLLQDLSGALLHSLERESGTPQAPQPK